MSLPSEISQPLLNQLLDFWFPPATVPLGTKSVPFPVLMKWFGAGPAEECAAFDLACSTGYKTALDSLSPSKFPIPAVKSWEEEQAAIPGLVEGFKPFITVAEGGLSREDAAKNTLALILLFDQMPRNIFRKIEEQGVIYNHYDRIARALAHHAYSLPKDLRPDLFPLWIESPVFRMWFYMPFTHSEDLRDHAIMDSEAREMVRGAEERGENDVKALAEKTLEAQVNHEKVLRRFGRYPYRNKAVGREDTEEEREWMESGGASWVRKDEKKKEEEEAGK